MLAERPKFLALRVSLQRFSGLPLWLLFIFMGRGSSQIEDHQASWGIGARALSRCFGAPFAGSACRHGETCDDHDFIQLWDGSHCSATIPLWTLDHGENHRLIDY